MAGKDLRIEARSRVAPNQVLPFALLVLVLFAFALDPDSGVSTGPRRGCFWVAVLFCALFAVQRAFALEAADGRVTRCGSRRSTRPASSWARPPRSPLSCWCWRSCSASAWCSSTAADLRAAASAARRTAWPTTGDWPRPVPSTASWRPGSGCGRPCCRCCCCRWWLPCSSAPPGPGRRRSVTVSGRSIGGLAVGRFALCVRARLHHLSASGLRGLAGGCMIAPRQSRRGRSRRAPARTAVERISHG